MQASALCPCPSTMCVGSPLPARSTVRPLPACVSSLPPSSRLISCWLFCVQATEAIQPQVTAGCQSPPMCPSTPPRAASAVRILCPPSPPLFSLPSFLPSHLFSDCLDHLTCVVCVQWMECCAWTRQGRCTITATSAESPPPSPPCLPLSAPSKPAGVSHASTRTAPPTSSPRPAGTSLSVLSS